ncbi:MAG TPA: electron transfer flavoprotein beta subunit/FixA family protein [Candidatus Bathyarchaeota archaeon]|nr:electron transfer flavoprotein beta subunit/FixA family protein [Candidatus Bathyarchaeota archaeon]
MAMPRIIVCLKQAVDVTQLKVDPQTSRLITAEAPRKISDFDKNALEEALKIRESLGGEVVTVTATAEEAKTTIREALAMGADKAYIIKDPAIAKIDTLTTARILAEAVKKLGEFDLVLCGEASIDSFSGQIASRLAEILNIPQLTSAEKMTVENGEVKVERALEDRYETVKAKMPALVSVTRGINQPRIPSLMAIMKASKKEIVEWNLQDLGFTPEKLDASNMTVEVLDVSAPKVERKKIFVKGETAAETAEKLVEALLQEGVVGR